MSALLLSHLPRLPLLLLPDRLTIARHLLFLLLEIQLQPMLIQSSWTLRPLPLSVLERQLMAPSSLLLPLLPSLRTITLTLTLTHHVHLH
jgi:hypothetical protein